MTKTTALSRRKLLGRIGLLAAAGYTVPALTTLSVAHAASGASGGSTSGASASASTSGASTSGASTSGASFSGPSNPTAVEAACLAETNTEADYLQCVLDKSV